ncbi:hypothetical protein L1987_57846 [Smallanthus sonchifolius]|uniref:Uncharacterized protein n=1 Tax=Smallanthus sonchifolius TaxID=185202 RepID=A0ACB9DE49_9ASTR|nr:hypothetical protein L1987_57846 [Smallanthus sonchifolius]
MSSTPSPSPKAPGHDAPILSSPEPKRRRTRSSDYSVDQGEPSSASLVDRVTHLETRVDTSDFVVGGILERVANLEAQLQVANHAAEGLQERVTHLEAQLQAALFPEDTPLSDDEEEPFEEEPFEDEPLEEEPLEEEPVEIDDAQSYVSPDDEDV